MYTFGSYDLSYLEFCVVILNLATVVAFRKNTMWAYPLSILTCIGLTSMLFQIHLYSEVVLNTYYVISAVAGALMWSSKSGSNLHIRYLSNSNRLGVVALIMSTTLVLGLTIDDVFSYLGSLVSSGYVHVPDSYPFVDSFVTVTSFVAMYLMIRRYVDSWVLWSLVNLANVILYCNRGVYFMSVEYVLLLANSLYAWYQWDRSDAKAFQIVRSNVERYIGTMWITIKGESCCISPIDLMGTVVKNEDLMILSKNRIKLKVGLNDIPEAIRCNAHELDVLSTDCTNKITIDRKVTYDSIK